MSYTVKIRRNADGVIREKVWTQDWAVWDEGSEFWWAEGNMSCDGNRAADFAQAGGEPIPEHVCGDAAYSVEIRLPDGTTVYSDMDRP